MVTRYSSAVVSLLAVFLFTSSGSFGILFILIEIGIVVHLFFTYKTHYPKIQS
jgi:hypothetical protein